MKKEQTPEQEKSESVESSDIAIKRNGDRWRINIDFQWYEWVIILAGIEIIAATLGGSMILELF